MRTEASSVTGTWKPGLAAAFLFQEMKRMVGMIDSRPTTAKAAILAQNTQL